MERPSFWEIVNSITGFLFVVGAWLFLGSLVVAELGNVAGMSNSAAMVLVGFLSLVGGWTFGKLRGRRLMASAKEAEKKAIKGEARTTRERKLANERWQEISRLEEECKRIQEAMDVAAQRVFPAHDCATILATRELAIERLLDVTITIGRFHNESHQEYVARRSALIRKRVLQWKKASRTDQHVLLLPIVYRQGGLCGDPRKDVKGKGCGCYLFCLPPTAIHLDHIVPKKMGGRDDPENLQALCAACNISAGARPNPSNS